MKQLHDETLLGNYRLSIARRVVAETPDHEELLDADALGETKRFKERILSGELDRLYCVQVALAAFDRGYALGVTSR